MHELVLPVLGSVRPVAVMVAEPVGPGDGVPIQSILIQ